MYIQPTITSPIKMIAEKTANHQLLDRIKSGGQKYLQELYNTYRKEFSQWTTKYFKLDEDVASEIYQQTFIAFYYNIKEGKLTQLNSSVKTYLFAIGKNLVKEHFKSAKKMVDTPEYEINPDEVDNSIMNKYEQAGTKEIIEKYLENLGEPCKTVIRLYYFHHYSMEAIANELGYKTEQIAAKRKFICLKQLKSKLEGINEF